MISEEAVLAGGCFWGMQELFRHLKGVINTKVGYTGGINANPSYKNHPEHAEALKITFNPSELSYKDLLKFFFQIHDSSTLNRQGNDIGSSYRSAIFYYSDEQRNVAEKLIREINLSNNLPGVITTTIEPIKKFWLAESEHQDYLQRYPQGYTCHFIRSNWVFPD